MGPPAKNVVFIVSFFSLPNIDEVKLKDQNKPNNTRNNKKQTKQQKTPNNCFIFLKAENNGRDENPKLGFRWFLDGYSEPTNTQKE